MRSATPILVSVLVTLATVAVVAAVAVALGVLSLGGPAASPTTAAGPTFTPAPTDSPTAEPTPSPSPAPTVSPSPTDEPTASPAPTPGGTHFVQQGESLSSIGLLYGVPWPLIAQANGIEEPYTIFIGQQLVIPSPDEPGPGGAFHIIQPGETLIEIAYLYGVSPTDLADENGIEDWDRIQAGQVLKIPGAEPEESASPAAQP